MSFTCGMCDRVSCSTNLGKVALNVIRSLEFSCDGLHLLSIANDNRAKIRSLATGECVAQFVYGENDPSSFQFPDVEVAHPKNLTWNKPWIEKQGKEVLRMPPEYWFLDTTVHGNMIAFGKDGEEIMLMDLSQAWRCCLSRILSQRIFK